MIIIARKSYILSKFFSKVLFIQFLKFLFPIWTPDTYSESQVDLDVIGSSAQRHLPENDGRALRNSWCQIRFLLAFFNNGLIF